jgi:hypothetical protein
VVVGERVCLRPSNRREAAKLVVDEQRDRPTRHSGGHGPAVAPDGLGLGERHGHAPAGEAFGEAVDERLGCRERRLGEGPRGDDPESFAGLEQRNCAAVRTHEPRQVPEEFGGAFSQTIRRGDSCRERPQHFRLDAALAFLRHLVVYGGKDFRLSVSRKASEEMFEPAFGNRSHEQGAAPCIP